MSSIPSFVETTSDFRIHVIYIVKTVFNRKQKNWIFGNNLERGYREVILYLTYPRLTT